MIEVATNLSYAKFDDVKECTTIKKNVAQVGTNLWRRWKWKCGTSWHKSMDKMKDDLDDENESTTLISHASKHYGWIIVNCFSHHIDS